MGREHKLLLPWGALTVVGTAARSASTVPGAHTVVVLGCRADEVQAAVTAGVQRQVAFTTNPRWAEGMFTSIEAGLAVLPDAVEAFFVVLGDMPLIPTEAYTVLIGAYKPGSICVPTFEGRRGHPVLVSRRLVDDTPPPDSDQGLRSVLRRYPELVMEVPLPYHGICVDLDTPEEYRNHKPNQATGL